MKRGNRQYIARKHKYDECCGVTEKEIEKYARSPIFIVGSPRSGTTLMRSIIDAHPHIFCPPCETFLFSLLNPIFNGRIWKDHYAQLPLDRTWLISWMRRFVLELFAALGKKIGKYRWTEKTPSHVRFMSFISEVFPDAQFIHMIRDGRKVVSSLKDMDWAPKDINKNIENWIESVSLGREIGIKIGKQRYIEIKYEDLVKDPETVLRRLCNFLKEPWTSQMLKFYKSENNSWGLSLQPIGIQSSRPELNEIEEDLFEELAGRLMRELGYS